MSECPSELDLARLVDGRLNAAEAEALFDHAADCPACSMALADLLEIRDLETEDLLPQPTDAEVDAAAHHLADLPAPALDGADTLDRPESGRMPQILDLFFGTAAAAGIAGVVGAAATDDSPAVSNAPLADSVSMGSRGDTDQPLAAKEAEIMDKNDMQPAMDEFFGPDAQPTSSAPQHIGAQGDPGEISGDVYQIYTDTCAIRSQQLVMRDFGINISQEQLMQEALNNDWYVPGAGTMPDDLGKLLEAHGVKVTRTEHANIFNLVSELAQGHRVIISVDSGELWESNPVAQTVAGANAETWEDWRPDHVVIVSGVDISDPNNPLVIVTDPGTGEVAATYSLPDFLEAWEDSGFSMVATADAPPSFDAEHVANIGALAYADFERWYPSVAELNGHEPGFAGLCAGFDGLMREPGINAPQSLNELLTVNSIAPIQPPDADWMSTIEHDLGHDLGHDLHHDMGLNTVDQPDSPDSDGDDGSGD